LSRGSGVTGVQKVSTGFYEVTFNQSVSSCAFFTTVGNPDGLEIPASESGASQNIGGGFSNLPSQVLVGTFTSTGTGADRPFYLAVLC
jgi:hypothetical protein